VDGWVAAGGVAVPVEKGREVEGLLNDVGNVAREVVLEEPHLELTREQDGLVRVLLLGDGRRTLLGRRHTPGEWAPGFAYVGRREDNRSHRRCRETRS
jgi:hypothetical protein